MLGARHLGSMGLLELLPALAQLAHHLIEVAAQVADFVVPAGETGCYRQVSIAELGDLLPKLDQAAAE